MCILIRHVYCFTLVLHNIMCNGTKTSLLDYVVLKKKKNY